MIELTATIESVRLSPPSEKDKEEQPKSQVSFRFHTKAYNSLTLLVTMTEAKQYAKMMAEGRELVFKMHVPPFPGEPDFERGA
jgi:hypothetical protein